ncbi:hypothetical protein QTP86_004415 [Hemibagrus guttatus]|nr:hypothetical protein QTP86_004415 [Hemibagrus guttatus]
MGLHYILKNLVNPGTYARILFVDFSSAFNNIIPDTLNKLTQLSVPPPSLLKFADDTTVIGLIQDGDDSTYRQEVEQLAVSQQIRYKKTATDCSVFLKGDVQTDCNRTAERTIVVHLPNLQDNSRVKKWEGLSGMAVYSMWGNRMRAEFVDINFKPQSEK